MYDNNIIINFGTVTSEVILAESCVMIVMYFVQKKTKKIEIEIEIKAVLRCYDTIQIEIFG